MDPALLIWIPVVALLLAPVVAVVLSKRARPMRKMVWLVVMFAAFVVGELIAGLYARERVNPLHPEFSELLTAMLIELSATITLVWLAYAGFWLTTRQRRPR